MDFLFTIVWCGLWGTLVMKMAEYRNRDKTIGFVLGALFGLIAVIGYWIAGKKRISE